MLIKTKYLIDFKNCDVSETIASCETINLALKYLKLKFGVSSKDIIEKDGCYSIKFIDDSEFKIRKYDEVTK